ncbi:MAG: kelch repeat-containing protein [Rhodothermales bacterium]
MSVFKTYLFVLFALLAEPAYSQDWFEVEPMPEARYGMSAVVVDGRIYVIGGRDRGGVIRSVLRYDPGSNEWSDDVRQMDKARSDAAAVVLDGRIYVIGGVDRDGEIVDDVEVYDPEENRWSEIHELEDERYGHSAIVLEGRIYVVGGVDEKNRLLESVEVYDPEEDEWRVSDRHRMAHPRVGFALVSIHETAYAFGGYGGGGGLVPLPNPERFILDTGFDLLPPEGILGARGRLAAVAVDDSVFILGGAGVRRVLDDVVIFSPSEEGGRWSVGPRLNTARESFSAVEVNGRIFAIGGRDSEERPIKSVEEMVLPASVASEEDAPTLTARLDQNHPNPFSTWTTIPYVVAGELSGHVVLEIYDVRGRLVNRLLDAHLAPGPHEIAWDGTEANGASVSSGVYFYLLRQGAFRRTRSLTRLR